MVLGVLYGIEWAQWIVLWCLKIIQVSNMFMVVGSLGIPKIKCLSSNVSGPSKWCGSREVHSSQKEQGEIMDNA